ncbi:hypothetical protein LMG29542_07835 [Paraburkholderia humisilvae]|uniref:TraD/TraG TraM recognition site domain-containing protein n=2 Tax=Paraburkholderia humisilvae TaxID=627669 RepID=A0A6J5F6G3_9BURK|nr:hypothetical protein LMG29542_07835 [Paraburkholderia humisilvae]
MREVIRRKYKNSLDPQVYWITGSIHEHTGLSGDPVERRVQRLSLSQIGVFLAQRMWARRSWIVTPAVFMLSLVLAYYLLNVSAVSTNAHLSPVLCTVIVWIGLMLSFGATLFQSVVAQWCLPRTPVRQDEIDSVRGVMARCVVRAVDADTPPDLRDRLRITVTDAGGQAVAGQVLATDLEYSAVRAEWFNSRAALFSLGLAFMSPAVVMISVWLAVLAWCAMHLPTIVSLLTGREGRREMPWHISKLAIVLLLLAPLLPGFPGSRLNDSLSVGEQAVQWSFVALMWFFALRHVLRMPEPMAFRALQLDQAVRETGTELLIDKAGREHFVQLEMARIEQIENATNDTSPFIRIGYSLGLLAQRRDPLAPGEKGLPVGLSLNDLSTHLMVIGASGTRKTTSVIRPVSTEWLAGDMGGMLVLDGKGTLPLQFAELPGFQLISPGHGAFNAIAGMSPDAVADVLADVFGADDDRDPTWADSARLMLRMAAIVLHAHPTASFTIPEILRFCTMDAYDRAALLEVVYEKADGRMRAAVGYWAVELPAMPEKTSGSIVNMVRTWLGNICLHERLGPWCDTQESGWLVEDLLIGAKAGLLLPESEYGAGGVAISALCMRRLYDAVKRRGDDWRAVIGQTPVLLVADEVQNLLTRADVETAPVARSLGLYLLFATQNLDGLYRRLERDGALQLANNFASLIALPPRTADSNEYVSTRAGRIWKATTQNYHGLPDAAADLGLYDNSGTDRTMREADLHRQRYAATPRLSYAVGLWHREWTPKSAALGQHVHDLVEPGETWQFTSKPLLALEPTPIVSPDEIDTLLARPGTAIAILNRGNVVRRDVIRLAEAA